MLLTRKEVAGLFSQIFGDTINTYQVMSNEKRWGIDKARKSVNRRVIRYDKQLAESAFRNFLKNQKT